MASKHRTAPKHQTNAEHRPASRRNAVLGLLIIVAVGCGRGSDERLPRASVRGQVTVAGKPLSNGLVKFVPLGHEQSPATVVPVTDGTFDVPSDNGPVVGLHRVDIVSTDDGGYAWDDEEALQTLSSQKTPPAIEVDRVPAVYAKRSPLRAEVVADESKNAFTFALESPQPRRNRNVRR